MSNPGYNLCSEFRNPAPGAQSSLFQPLHRNSHKSQRNTRNQKFTHGKLSSQKGAGSKVTNNSTDLSRTSWFQTMDAEEAPVQLTQRQKSDSNGNTGTVKTFCLHK